MHVNVVPETRPCELRDDKGSYFAVRNSWSLILCRAPREGRRVWLLRRSSQQALAEAGGRFREVKRSVRGHSAPV